MNGDGGIMLIMAIRKGNVILAILIISTMIIKIIQNMTISKIKM